MTSSVNDACSHLSNFHFGHLIIFSNCFHVFSLLQRIPLSFFLVFLSLWSFLFCSCFFRSFVFFHLSSLFHIISFLPYSFFSSFFFVFISFFFLTFLPCYFFNSRGRVFSNCPEDQFVFYKRPKEWYLMSSCLTLSIISMDQE